MIILEILIFYRFKALVELKEVRERASPAVDPYLILMKTHFIAFTLSAVLAASSAVAGVAPYSDSAASPLYDGGEAAAGGLFVGLKGSALWLEDMGYLTTTSVGTVGLEAEFDVGWGTTIPFGYQFANGVSLGGSIGYYTAGVDEMSVLFRGRYVGDVNLDADAKSVPLFFNASYDFKLSDTLSLTLGAGAGVAWTEFSVDEVAGVDYDLSTDGWNFGFQGFGSMNYSVNPTTDLTLGYRYIQTELDEDSIQGHNVEAGVVVHF